MDTYSPAILSGKKAEKHVDKIRAEHSNMLEQMLNQQQRVTSFNQNKAMEKQAMDQQSLVTDRENKDRELKSTEMQNNNQKSSMDYNLKTKELEIKKLALTQPE